MSKCHRDKIIPHGLSVSVGLSIGNRDEVFFETWHENLHAFMSTYVTGIQSL